MTEKPLRCTKCGDTDGPFAERDGDIYCEPCLPGGAK